MKRTKILILITLIIFIFAIIGSYMVLHHKVAHKTAIITQDNKTLYTIDLDDVKEPYTLKIYGENNLWNCILVEPGQIRIESASCPDMLCVKQGAISNGKLPIVCLPNHVQIKIVDTEEETEIDAQVY
ncbi:MAG: NusG domain II-containing protein [Ruminococcus sp.]|nr:NusG domain II-containing protein [Ruminococcus sp.]